MSLPCAQTGCNGTIEDGYCDQCGMAAPKAAGSKPLDALNLSQVNGDLSQRLDASARTSAPSRRSSAVTAATSGTFSSSIAGRSTSTRRTSTSQRSTRKSLGAGLISLPDLPSADPEKALLTEAIVPENKRFCSNCNQSLKREKGFCPKCGQKYSFLSTLQRGDIVAGQYEVRGALAFGGLGWIYLGFDRILSRYVVLKGLLNTEDASSAAVAVAEKQFLASVKHPNIVGIYNFVNQGSEGFIVMEYVGGKTLKELRKERGVLPVAESIAYIHRILSSFAYLHSQGLVYCDFKPDNIMVEGSDVKLIDMGGVRRIDDPDGDIYGTVGYTAPEAGEGPTVVSDLYTVARTLAVLVCSIRGFTRENLHSLPTPIDEPLFADYESLYRFLLRATAPNPNDRFQSAEEMADQLLGVLREVVALETKQPCPSVSHLFGGDRLAELSVGMLEPVLPNILQVPLPNSDSSDSGSQYLMGLPINGDPSYITARLEDLRQRMPGSNAIRYRLAYQYIQTHQGDRAVKLLQDAIERDPWDWRATWYQGCLAMSKQDSKKAIASFNQVYADLPGELAPKLALGLAHEQAKEYQRAIDFYELVWRTNPDYVTAAFGLARCQRSLQQNRKMIVMPLQQIPPSSSLYSRAQAEVTQIWSNTQTSNPTVEELRNAAKTLEQLTLDQKDQHQLQKQILSTTLQLVQARDIRPDPNLKILGQSVEEVSLREGLERVLRSLAHLSEGSEKIALIDEANRVRPKTWM